MVLVQGSQQVSVATSRANEVSVLVVYEALVLRPLLFIIVHHPITVELMLDCFWEHFYSDDFALIAKSLWALGLKFKVWKQGLG